MLLTVFDLVAVAADCVVSRNVILPLRCATVCCILTFVGFFSSCCIFMVNCHKNCTSYTVLYCINTVMQICVM